MLSYLCGTVLWTIVTMVTMGTMVNTRPRDFKMSAYTVYLKMPYSSYVVHMRLHDFNTF